MLRLAVSKQEKAGLSAKIRHFSGIARENPALFFAKEKSGHKQDDRSLFELV